MTSVAAKAVRADALVSLGVAEEKGREGLDVQAKRGTPCWSSSFLPRPDNRVGVDCPQEQLPVLVRARCSDEHGVAQP